MYSLASEPWEKFWGHIKTGAWEPWDYFFDIKKNPSLAATSRTQTDDGLGYEMLLPTEDDCKPFTGYDVSVVTAVANGLKVLPLHLLLCVPRPHEHQL